MTIRNEILVAIGHASNKDLQALQVALRDCRLNRQAARSFKRAGKIDEKEFVERIHAINSQLTDALCALIYPKK